MIKKDKGIYKDSFTTLLKAAMRNKNIKTPALAEKIGYTKEGTRKIILGRGSYYGVLKVCEALDIKIESLIKETSHEQH